MPLGALGTPKLPQIRQNHGFSGFLQIFCDGFGGSKATTAMPESTAVGPESVGPNRGMATPFSPDFVFSEPLLSCSRSPKQARKPAVRPGSLEFGFEASHQP